MSYYYCTPSQMREMEKSAVSKGITYEQLMENAGCECASHILEEYMGGKVSVLCGKGNNGGDGFVIARNLNSAGVDVSVLMIYDEVQTELAAKKLGEVFEHKISVINFNDSEEKFRETLYESTFIIDAVFGTGFHGELEENVSKIFEFVNKCPAKKIAVDIPSGGNGLSGRVSKNTVKCDETLSMAIEKIGTSTYPLSEYTGKVTVLDIKIPQSVILGTDKLIRKVDDEFVKEIYPPRKKDSNKGTFGKALNIAGCESMPGAACLSTLSACRSGAGLVTLASVSEVIGTLSGGLYEAVYLKLEKGREGEISASNEEVLLEKLKKSTACAIGCGLSVTEDTKKLVKSVLKNAEIPVIIDADGINIISQSIDIIRNAKGRFAVTPHPGELSRLMGVSIDEILENRLEAALRFNSLYETVILAKGTPTFIIGNNSAYVSFTGNPGLSKGGSGDTLTGIALGLCSMGIPLEKSLAAAAYIHGRAADIAAAKLSQTALLATDVISCLPLVFKELNR